MYLVCSAWFHDVNPDNGDTLEEFYSNRNCSFVQDTVAYIDDEGDISEYSDSNGGEIYCNEHETNPRWYDDRLTQALHYLTSDRNDIYICEDHDDIHEYLVFDGVTAYNEHRLDDHGDENEDTAEETVAPAIDLPHAYPFTPHPPLSSEARTSVLAYLQAQRDNGYLPVGVLVAPSDNANHVWTRIGQPSQEQLREWRRYYPGQFYMHVEDPHLKGEPGRSLHTSW